MDCKSDILRRGPKDGSSVHILSHKVANQYILDIYFQIRIDVKPACVHCMTPEIIGDRKNEKYKKIGVKELHDQCLSRYLADYSAPPGQ